MAKKRKPKMELRYYKMPEGSPILALLGQKWSRIMGTISIISIFIIIWKSGSAMKDRDL